MKPESELAPLHFDFQSEHASEHVLDQLKTNGFAYLKQGIDRETAENVSTDVWNYLELVDVYRNRTASWPVGRPQRGPIFRAIRDYEEGLLPLFSEKFERDIATLINPKLRVGQEKILYMTFPNANQDLNRWRVPWAMWHNDFIGDGTGKTRAYLGFVLLNDVQAGGGNLVFLSASHRLDEVVAPQHASAIMKQLSRKSTVLERLWDRREEAQGAVVGERCNVDGIELQLLEMIGSKGDVFILDGSLLHAPTSNERSYVRLAAKCFLYFKK